jgi:predicted Zn-dependent protease
MYRWLCCAFFGGAVVFSAAAAPADPPPASEVAQGEQLYNDGKFKESIQVLDPYLRAHPQDATALVEPRR